MSTHDVSRVTHSEPWHLVNPSDADLECVHGLIGHCTLGHWTPTATTAPATLADFECVHLVIGHCPACWASQPMPPTTAAGRGGS